MNGETEEPGIRGFGNEEHIAYLLASAMQLQKRCARGLGVDEEDTPPFSWRGADGSERQLTRETFQQAGQMLLEQNFQAWWGGYPPEAEPTPGIRFRITWAEPRPWVWLEPVEIIRSAHGYAANARGRDWKGSEASGFIKKVIRMAVTCLPGYDRAGPGAPHDMARLVSTRWEWQGAPAGTTGDRDGGEDGG